MDRSLIEKTFEQEKERFLSEWKEFLVFKSISTDPAYAPDCRECAEWLLNHLKKLGFEGELLETSGNPVVFAQRVGEPSKPTVVFYGHYDVQPVDPIELWKSDPFKPVLRDGRLYARGAQDNKGQVFYFLKALETLIKNNALNSTVKLFIEGEEESSSHGITEALPSWKDRTKGDILMVCDTGCLKPGVPTITMGLRGILNLTVKLSGLTKDLHSGVHGGVAPNPALEMARLLATLHTAVGIIAVKGFYDSVTPVDDEDRALSSVASLSTDEYKALTGVTPDGGEKGLSFSERRGLRPTIEVNGIHSGYGGPGTKTIIPSEAIAKLSARVVGGQDPEKILELIIDHLKSHAPKALTLEISEQGVGGPALLLSSKSEVVKRATDVLKGLFTVPVVYLWEGASIPIVSLFVKVSGAEPLLVGFGLDEDNIHAPNESFSIEQWKQGFLYASMFLAGL